VQFTKAKPKGAAIGILEARVGHQVLGMRLCSASAPCGTAQQAQYGASLFPLSSQVVHVVKFVSAGSIVRSSSAGDNAPSVAGCGGHPKDRDRHRWALRCLLRLGGACLSGTPASSGCVGPGPSQALLGAQRDPVTNGGDRYRTTAVESRCVLSWTGMNAAATLWRWKINGPTAQRPNGPTAQRPNGPTAQRLCGSAERRKYAQAANS